jgi:DNA-binding response OmpR family regulator
MYDILIVDDDAQMLDMVGLILEREGYYVQRAYSSHEALAKIEDNIPDLFVIDALLPEMDGLTLCRRLRGRSETANVPIIFVTGRDSPYGVADALAAGGDDYIRKPFAPRELVARVRAHIRRSAFYGDGEMPIIHISPANYKVLVNERDISLTRVEFDLLRYMCKAPYQLHSTEDLLANVWQYPNGVGDSALVRNHIHNLRRKVEDDPDRPQIIQSRHGRGYVLKAHVELDE